MTCQRPVFFISDSTGITVETLGHSLLTQFASIDFVIRTFRYVDSEEKAHQIHGDILAAGEQYQCKPLVFSTVVNDAVRDILTEGQVQFFDFMEEFISPLETELGIAAASQAGFSHSASVDNDYLHRMDAVTYAFNNDDGGDTRHYDEADIIIIGVSRSGKTPTCMYLALHYGLYAANYPFVEQDLDNTRLPRVLQPYQHKLFGLGISAERLQQIRANRRPDSRYAAMHQCQYEVRQLDALFRQYGIPHLDVTRLSVEEIATWILDRR